MNIFNNFIKQVDYVDWFKQAQMMTKDITAYGMTNAYLQENPNEMIAAVGPVVMGNCNMVSVTQQGGACGGHSSRRQHHNVLGLGGYPHHQQHYHSTQQLYNEIPQNYLNQKPHHSHSRSRSRRFGSNGGGGSRYSMGHMMDDQNETCEQVDQSAFDETHAAEYINNTSTNINNNTTVNYPETSNLSTNQQNQFDEELENLLRQNEETWIIYCSGKYNVEYQHQHGSKKIILKEKCESDSDSSICDYYIKKYKVPKINHTNDSTDNQFEKSNETQYTGNAQDANLNGNYIEVTITNTKFVGGGNDEDMITGPGSELIKKLVNGSDSFSPTSTYREFSQNFNFPSSHLEQPIPSQQGYQYGSNNNLNNNYFDSNNYYNSSQRQAQPSATNNTNYSYTQAPGYSSYDSHQHIYYQPQNFYQTSFEQPYYPQQQQQQQQQQQYSQPATFSAPMPPQQYANTYNQQIPPYQNMNGYGPASATGLYQQTPFMTDLDNYASSRHYHLLKKSSDDDDTEEQVFQECRKSSTNVRGDKRRNSKRLSGSVRRALEAFNNDEEDSYRCCTASNCKSSRGHQMITSYHGSRLSSARPISSQYEQSADIEVCESTSGEELEELELEPKEKISQFSGIDNCIKIEQRGVRESFLKSGCQSSSGNIMVGLLDAQEALSIGPGSLAGGSLFEGVLPSNFDTASQKIISAKQSQINHDEKSAFSEYNKDEEDENESRNEQKSQLIYSERVTIKQVESAYNIEVAKYANNKIPISKLYKVIDRLNITMPTDEFNKATYLLGIHSNVSLNKFIDLLTMLGKLDKSSNSMVIVRQTPEEAETKRM